MRRLSVKITIAAGFAALIVLSGIIALNTYSGITKINNTLSEFNKIDEQKKHINNFLIYYLESQVALNSLLTIELGTEEAEFRTALTVDELFSRSS